ncbi:MAG: succinate dehydrogenase, hydrophobic membrane anchor protein [Rickettsiales bacterium]|nr:succinate dehydrogenase, hydrophobic membrane anchor protein [Rickettsiales bacterium]|tara:strand:+ start:2487 stop:2816 length:330 start_codon:yes stop_codon:yes gene_type:complete
MKYSYSTAWIFQKLLALIFLFLLIYLTFSLNNISLSNYIETSNWFSNKLNNFLFFILFTSIVLHSNLGLNSIIDDYIHQKKSKKKIIVLKNSFLVIIYIIAIVSLIILI